MSDFRAGVEMVPSQQDKVQSHHANLTAKENGECLLVCLGQLESFHDQYFTVFVTYLLWISCCTLAPFNLISTQKPME